MLINLGVNSSDDTSLYKRYTLNPYTGYLKEDCDIINPTFVINAPIDTIASVNYAEIPAFSNRKYFVKNITSETATTTRIDLNIDVLETYNKQIEILPAYIERSYGTYNPYLVDGDAPISVIRNTVIHEFPNAPTSADNTTVIVMAGEGVQNGNS